MPWEELNILTGGPVPGTNFEWVCMEGNDCTNQGTCTCFDTNLVDPIVKYHKDTGEVLWEMELPAGTAGAPMTYMADGKQYIVVGIGESGRPAEFIALSLR